MTLSKERLREMLAGLEGVTPGPWQIGRLGTEDMPHVVDFGPPPKSPYMIVRPGSPAKGGYTGHSPGGVVHSDDNSSHANAAHIARCDPDTMREILTLALSALSLRSDAHTSGEVKALEWHGTDVNGDIYATSVLGTYTIRKKQGSMGYWLTQVGGYHSTVEKAKAAAQADFETRIRSALSRGHPIQGEAVAWERTEVPIYDNVAPRIDVTRDPELAEMWRNHPFTQSMRPLFASPQPPTPAGVREITDEMVERFCAEYFGTEWEESSQSWRASMLDQFGAAAKGAGHGTR